MPCVVLQQLLAGSTCWPQLQVRWATRDLHPRHFPSNLEGVMVITPLDDNYPRSFLQLPRVQPVQGHGIPLLPPLQGFGFEPGILFFFLWPLARRGHPRCRFLCPRSAPSGSSRSARCHPRLRSGARFPFCGCLRPLASLSWKCRAAEPRTERLPSPNFSGLELTYWSTCSWRPSSASSRRSPASSAGAALAALITSPSDRLSSSFSSLFPGAPSAPAAGAFLFLSFDSSFLAFFDSFFLFSSLSGPGFWSAGSLGFTQLSRDGDSPLPAAPPLPEARRVPCRSYTSESSQAACLRILRTLTSWSRGTALSSSSRRMRKSVRQLGQGSPTKLSQWRQVAIQLKPTHYRVTFNTDIFTPGSEVHIHIISYMIIIKYNLIISDIEEASFLSSMKTSKLNF